ncbi:MAG TPA: phosphoribosylformylglycinamidine synthase subunit PurS [Candidatus Binataceae bacterium]|nr:phosphoribosylformylglycinamidine synthase subunit PurS [Candidatus Binataceae bacterium]
MQVKVFVTPRKGILDPQGRTVEHALASLGFAGVSDVKIGRYITLNIEAKTPDEARASASKMCEQLLANPNIEDFRFEIDGSEYGTPKTAEVPTDRGRKFDFRDG